MDWAMFLYGAAVMGVFISMIAVAASLWND